MKKILLYSVLVAGMLSSCDLDINDDPDYPMNDQVTADLIFPAAQTLVASHVGGEIFNNAGFFAQYFEQRPESQQYDALPTYAFTEASDIMSYSYSGLMAGAQKDLKDIIDKSENSADRYAATVLRAYVFQVMVDNFDQFPYTEALQGADNQNPKWDKGEDVYKGVLAEMDKAEQELNDATMDSEDLMFDGDVSQWKGFANALRLRMYLRLISGGVDAAGYEAKVKELVENNSFFTGDVCFSGFADESNKRNPWYETNAMGLTGNHCAAYPLVEYLKATDDPRRAYGLSVATATNSYVGQLPGGKMNTRSAKGNSNLWMNKHVSGIDYTKAATMPVYYFTQSELQFLIAEVYLKYLNNDAQAEAAYEKGIDADFASRGLSRTAAFDSKIAWPTGGSLDEKMELIGKQKWVALFYRDHMEAWSELRRTDYPKYVTLTNAELTAIAKGENAPADKYKAGDLIVPWQNDMINPVGDKVIKRIYYPLSARKYNSNTPQSPSLDSPVWWDKN